MLDLVFKNLTPNKRCSSKFFEKILVAGIKETKLSNPEKSRSDLGAIKNIGISVNLVGEARIRELNKKYRNKNKVTDVLSFPMSENPQSLPAYQLTSLKTLDLGDIFICLSFAKREAKSENVSIGYKLAQLTIHGFLHLLGYDHEKSDKGEIEMFKLENQILNKLEIK